MYKKLKPVLIVLLIVTTSSFFCSCSNDNDEFAGDRTEKSDFTNLAKQAQVAHTLTIVNNSKFAFAIFRIGAQSNCNLYDPIEIYHESSPAIIVQANSQVTYYDYKHVNNSACAINEWNVIDHSRRDGDLGSFGCDEMAMLYGMQSNPSSPRSDKYPVWNYIKAGLHYNGQYLQVLGGTHPGAFSDYLGNTDQSYSNILKFGNMSIIEGDALGVPGHAVPLAIVKWSQQSVGVRNTGAVKITIENMLTR
jgi:hypothetical protein